MTNIVLNDQSPSFQSHQLAFTQWIRHPDDISLPNGISAQRMNTYRDLIFNNIESFVEHTYPITKALLKNELWQDLIKAFFQYGQCDSPYYYDISLHFREFLEHDIFTTESSEESSPLNHLKHIHSDYPWLRELLQYEWMELYVEMAEVDWLNDSASLQLKTTCWILAYQYPVHTWSTNTTMNDIQGQPSCLLVFRDQNFITHVYPIHPLWALIIDILQTQKTIQLEQLQEQIVQTTQLPATEIQDVLLALCAWLQTRSLLLVDTAYND